VHDADMTPEHIVASSLSLGLDVISITDHNEISGVDAALRAADGTKLLVVPGVELSTPQGHLLAYLPTLAALHSFHGRLQVVDRGKAESRCQNSMIDCLNLLKELGGIGILAHLDSPGGFETENPGGSPHKMDVLAHGTLVGVELKSATSAIAYSDVDPDPVRAQAGAARIGRLGLGAKQFLARVMFSDAHSLVSLGRNAAGDKKVTRIKMDVPSFDALRIALDESDARVRIEELIPAATPQILGVQINGGFLEGQEIHFSRNLSCIIGGRGTGKSTVFETLRCLSSRAGGSDVVDSEVWPADLRLYWQDAAGERHSLQRLIGESVCNMDDEVFGPVSFEVDCYGQGETARLSQRAQADPLALLEYLDKFVDLSDSRPAEDAARDQLLDLQTKIEEAELQVAQIPLLERSLATTRQQLKASEKANAAELIRLQRELATERELRTRVTEEWRQAQGMLTSDRAREKMRLIQGLGDQAQVSVGGPEFKTIASAAALFEKGVAEAEGQLKVQASAFDAVLVEQVRLWKAREHAALQTIETKRKELEAQGIRLDMGFIQKLAKDEATYQKNLEILAAWKPHLTNLRKQRAEALKQRWTARDRVATRRDAYARQASATLKSVLSDLQVSLKMARNACAPEAADLIQQAMGWRTNQVPRATLLTQRLTLPVLLDVIEQKDAAAITALTFDDGSQPFDTQDAHQIIERLTDQKVRFALERCAVHELPRLSVTRKIDGASDRFITRDFGKLSLGQQQSVLLALLLSSNGTHPLIIDQPEDNLDGEFIYSTFVPVLRRAKERRQVVVVTHNANVAVLGDAEQIIVMKSHNDRGIVTARGSIDNPAIRGAACAILEGAAEAFLRRSKIYGIPGR